MAVFDFEITTNDKEISRPLADKVIYEFSRSGKYEVIDRGNMNKILYEQKFQMSGCVAQECKVEAGQILGVGKIVNGSVGMVGKVYYLTLQLINVQTGKIEITEKDECRCEPEELLGSTRMLAKKLLGEKVDSPETMKPKSANVIARDGRFEKLASGVVRDTQTGLDWFAGPNKDTSWDDAKQWTANLKVDGGDWRMPRIEELKSLYQKKSGSRNITPLLETTGWFIWSGNITEYASYKNMASVLDLNNGNVSDVRRDEIANEINKRGFAVRFTK